MNRRIVGAALALVAIAAIHQSAAQLSAQAPETYTAKATVGALTENASSLPITFVINKFTTDAEHTKLRDTLKQGSGALKAALKALPSIGTIPGNNKQAAIKYAYRRPNSQSITVLMDEPVAYLDPGTAKDRPKEGFDLAFATLDFSTVGFGVGELDPAVKLSVNPSGMIVTETYGAARVRLTSVEKKK